LQNKSPTKAAAPTPPEPKVKATDKYLLQKFNKDFDTVMEGVVESTASASQVIEEEELEYQ
jgi:hypothetical protein